MAGVIYTQYLLNWLIDHFYTKEKKKWRLPWVWSDLSKLNFVHNAQRATRLSDGLRPSKTKQKYMKCFLYSHSTFIQSNCSILLSAISPEGTNELFSILFSSSKNRIPKEKNNFCFSYMSFDIMSDMISGPLGWLMDQILIRLF